MNNLHRDIVLQSFCRMNKGRLDLELPDGGVLLIGDGKEPIHARIRIRDCAFFKRCIHSGHIGLRESYVDGLWDTDDITKVLSWSLLNAGRISLVSNNSIGVLIPRLMKRWNGMASPGSTGATSISRYSIAEQYDLGNDFFRLFLDPTMTWSGAYFQKDGMDLEAAQLAKYERLCGQLRLSPADHVLEIGSGWGDFAFYIAKNHGCQVTSLAISGEQFQMASRRVKEEGLEDRVTILHEDFLNLSGKFDRIVSVETLEITGDRHLDVYFEKCHDLLDQHGILVLQVITRPGSRFDCCRLQPSVSAINAAVCRKGEMTLIDLKELGLHYAATLKVWFMQFNSRLAEVRALGFDDRFIRKWNYYLCYCEAAFRMRNLHMMQLVYARPNNPLR